MSVGVKLGSLLEVVDPGKAYDMSLPGECEAEPLIQWRPMYDTRIRIS